MMKQLIFVAALVTALSAGAGVGAGAAARAHRSQGATEHRAGPDRRRAATWRSDR